MIAIVAVGPKVILGQQYLFSPHIEPSVFFFWENMTYGSKNIPFLPHLNYALEKYLQEENTGRASSSSHSRLVVQSADRRPMKKQQRDEYPSSVGRSLDAFLNVLPVVG
jgi:hypothetical protein